MRILWVEDFGASATAQGLLSLFAGVLSPELRYALDPRINDLIEGSTAGGKSYWDRVYRDLPQWEPTEIHVATQYEHIQQLLGQNDTPYLYDIALIDYDLTEFFSGSHPEGIDPSRAGIWIYNQLVRTHFPADRIAFLTANEKKVEKFAEECAVHYLLPAPLCFSKDKPALTDKPDVSLAKWVEGLEKRDGGYLVLRRGLLDGCGDLADSLHGLGTGAEERIGFNHFLPKEASVSVGDMCDFVRSLTLMLPIARPDVDVDQDRPCRTYRLFLRVLVHEWENETAPHLVSRRAPLGAEEKDIRPTLGYVMKRARNWLTHGDRLDRVSIREVAFLFLISTRIMFAARSDRMEPYELQLMRLIAPRQWNCVPQAVLDLAEEQLHAADYTIRALWETCMDDPNDKERESTKKKSPRDYVPPRTYGTRITRLDEFKKLPATFDCVKALYLMLWFGLYPREPRVMQWGSNSHPKWLSDVLVGTMDIAFGEKVAELMAAAGKA